MHKSPLFYFLLSIQLLSSSISVSSTPSPLLFSPLLCPLLFSPYLPSSHILLFPPLLSPLLLSPLFPYLILYHLSSFLSSPPPPSCRRFFYFLLSSTSPLLIMLQGTLCIKSIKMQRLALLDNRGREREEEEIYVSVQCSENKIDENEII